MQFSRMAAAAVGAILLTAGDAVAQSTVLLATDSTNREVWRGQTAGSQAGFSLDRGDVSAGDGRRDLIAGAPGWSSGTGRVYVVFGGPVRRGEVSFSNANAILTGAAAGDRFGEATAAGYITARELDDPTRDLVVGAPGANSNSGVVYVYRRGLTHGQQLATSAAILTITGAPAGARLGAALATGDLDGDGYREIIAGAPGVGRIYVIRGGATIGGTVDLSTPSAAFFEIHGSAIDGVGRALAAGDLTGHSLDTANPNTIYDLAVGVYNEAGGGAVYVIRGRTSNTFPATMNLTTQADARFGGLDVGDQAGWSVEVAPFDRDDYYDLMIGAPSADGPGNGRPQGGEIYVIWGSPTLASRSLASADLTIYGAAAGHYEGSDLAYGNIARQSAIDLVSHASGASSAGELHVVLGRSRSAFGSVYDFAFTLPDRRFVGDPAAGPITSTVSYDLTGEGFEDVVAGVPGAGQGLVYVSFSPSYEDTGEPNNTSATPTSMTPGFAISSYVFTSNDVDWYRFTLGEDAHTRVRLLVPASVSYGLELYNSSLTLLEISDSAHPGIHEEILRTLSAGTYYVRVYGYGVFSQPEPYTLLTSAGFFNDAFEPNNVISSAVTIGSLPYQAKVYTPQDVDWYRFQMAGSGTVTVQLTVPPSIDLRLDLYAASGALLASSQNAAGVNETITHGPIPLGQHLIRVSSVTGSSTSQNYTLAVSGTGSNPVIPNLLLGQGPHSDGGWFAVHGGAESGFGPSAWGRLPWPGYNAAGGGVRLATGDVDGDGADEIVVGLGTGSNGYAAVLDDAANGYALLAWLRVPWAGYIAANGGETFPSVGDLDGDGRAEIVLGLGNGGQGWYVVFDDASEGFRHLVWKQINWAAYNATGGPTHPAVGDVDGDGVAEIVVGLGAGSAGWLEVVEGVIASSGRLSNFSHRAWIQIPWPTYNSANGTSFPAVGDLDEDGRAEIVAGLGNGSAGWFQIIDDAATGFAHVKWDSIPWPNYNAHNGETHPAIGNIDGDPAAEIVFGFAQYPGNGGWFALRDDAASGYAHLGWRNVGWPTFTASGGALFPAIATRR